ncbi:glycosyltransferase [Natronomonas sp. F2-12]|uniref:Glycosyltransferase n=1 Tax=Natronomonas aquatica TaxID=2841590 RepID=A0A9R1CSE5_9EURY|nr:glycosyltransferase [Natronomonas aquatica]MCQ4333122.1 glycosyltransferase [Natronomonas aquatica]
MPSLQIKLFMHSFRGGGAEKIMVRIGNELSNRGHKVELLLVENNGPYKSLVNPELRVAEIGGKNIYQIFYNLWGYLSEKNDLDVLLSTLEIPNIVSLTASYSSNTIPVVLRIANTNSMKERSGKYRIIPVLKKFVYPYAESIITVSEDVAHDLPDTISQDKIVTINNPSYHSKILKLAQEPIDHDWINDPEKDVVISVGNLKPQKDYSTLIRAIRDLNQEDRRFLVILGKGNLKKDLENLAEELDVRDRISFPGFVDNPYAYMSKSDVFVLSSAWEGFPNVVVEAMACGTPVVCTDCPGGSSDILNDGMYGTLVPVGDHHAIAEAINSMLLNPTDDIELISRAKEFSIDKICDDYERVLISAAN